MISDGYPKLPRMDSIEGVAILRLKSVGFPPLLGNQALQAAIEAESPDAVLWHVGTTSSLHLDISRAIDRPIIALFTSPIYTLKDFYSLGIRGLASELNDLSTQLASVIVPPFLVRRLLQNSSVKAIITLSAVGRESLIKIGISEAKLFSIPPGVDENWFNASLTIEETEVYRKSVGFQASDFVVAYFGSPAQYRGCDTLLEAAVNLSTSLPSLRLLILSRRREGEFNRAHKRLESQVRKLDLSSKTRVISKFMQEEELISHLASVSAVALPFKLVPSEAPLSVLESMALGKPVISTLTDGLPELLADGRGILVRPGCSEELASAIQHLAESPNASTAIARKAKEFAVSRGGWPQVASRILDVISSEVH